MKTCCPHCHQPVTPDDLVPQPKAIPPGCVCNPNDWFRGIIHPICAAFQPSEDDEEDELCANCEHERGCHHG